MVIEQNEKDTFLIRLTPNCSATWGQTQFVVFSVSALALFIALFWALQGAWVILPFAGIEVLILTFIAYKVSSQTHQQQVLYFTNDQIKIEQGNSRPTQTWNFNRQHCEFLIQRPEHSLSASIVELRCQKKLVRIGERLSKIDIDNLITILKKTNIEIKFKGMVRTVAFDKFPID